MSVEMGSAARRCNKYYSDDVGWTGEEEKKKKKKRIYWAIRYGTIWEERVRVVR